MKPLAFASQSRYTRAKQAAGFYQDELLPVAVPNRKGPPTMVTEDEHPRPETTLDARGTAGGGDPAFE